MLFGSSSENELYFIEDQDVELFSPWVLMRSRYNAGSISVGLVIQEPRQRRLEGD